MSMHPQQKAAWFVLIVFLATAALYFTAIPLLSWWFHRPWTSAAVPALGIFGLCGLWGFVPLFYKSRHNGKPLMDERDQLLALRAWRTGMGVFWLVFVFGCVGSWAFMQYVRGLDQIIVPTALFPLMVIAATIIFEVTQSLVTLHYYGWRSNDAFEQ